MSTSFEGLCEFSDMWGADADNYVILRTIPESKSLDSCIIVDLTGRSAVVIEDDATALEAMKRMVQAGVKIVDSLPEHSAKCDERAEKCGSDAAQVLHAYKRAASEHGWHTREGRTSRAKAKYEQLQGLLARLIAAHADERLFSLYEHGDPWVQLWAAVHTLELNESAAVAKLNELSRSGISFASVHARSALDSWKRGEITFRCR